MAYGVVSIVIGIAILVGTCWAVERLDRRDRGEGRVVWRPWYRTAAACAYYVVIGALATFRDVTGTWLLFEFFWLAGFPILIVLQVLTRSSIWLQALEMFGVCLSLAFGAVVSEGLGLATRDLLGESLVAFGGIFSAWFAALTAIAVTCTMAARGLSRLRRLPDR